MQIIRYMQSKLSIHGLSEKKKKYNLEEIDSQRQSQNASALVYLPLGHAYNMFS